MGNELLRFAQRATVQTLDLREQRYRMANRDDHHARAWDSINDMNRPHDLSMEITIRLPTSLTEKEREACEKIVAEAWHRMFYGILRETHPKEQP